MEVCLPDKPTLQKGTYVIALFYSPTKPIIGWWFLLNLSLFSWSPRLRFAKPESLSLAFIYVMNCQYLSIWLCLSGHWSGTKDHGHFKGCLNRKCSHPKKFHKANPGKHRCSQKFWPNSRHGMRKIF